jgi:hypothetical protein
MSFSNLNTSPDYDRSGSRFGRLVREFLLFGELRRQKKSPHVEVFYIWVHSEAQKKKVLRSINNCSNDQITDAIRNAGDLIERHMCDRSEGEQVLDIYYKELARRVEAAERTNARPDKEQAGT